MVLKAAKTTNLVKAKSSFFIQTIRQLLAARSVKIIEENGKELKHAGILVPVVLEGDILKILLTRRSRQVSNYKGQISFPGGVVDPEDRSYEETALRETFEEIGVTRKEIEVLGRMDDIGTVASGFIIHPFIGYIFEGNSFCVNTCEVDNIIKIPLAFFLNAGSRKYSVSYEGNPYETVAYRYYEDLIWGATAGIITNLTDMIKDKIDLLQEKK